MSLLCKEIDLDFEFGAEDVLFVNAKETIAYLESIIKNIEKRVLDGEKIDGLRIKEGAKKRVINKDGIDYLIKTFPEDIIYEKKLVGIATLEKNIGKKEMDYLLEREYIEFSQNKSSVVVE